MRVLQGFVRFYEEGFIIKGVCRNLSRGTHSVLGYVKDKTSCPWLVAKGSSK